MIKVVTYIYSDEVLFLSDMFNMFISKQNFFIFTVGIFVEISLTVWFFTQNLYTGLFWGAVSSAIFFIPIAVTGVNWAKYFNKKAKVSSGVSGSGTKIEQ